MLAILECGGNFLGMNYETRILSFLASKGYDGARSIAIWQSLEIEHAVQSERTQFDNTLARLLSSEVLERSVGLNDSGGECRFYNIK